MNKNNDENSLIVCFMKLMVKRKLSSFGKEEW